MKTQLDLVLKENKILKNKNNFDIVLEKNNDISSKLKCVLKENDSLKNKIAWKTKLLGFSFERKYYFKK